MPPKKRKRKTSKKKSLRPLLKPLVWLSAVLLTSLAVLMVLRLPHHREIIQLPSIPDPVKIRQSAALPKNELPKVPKSLDTTHPNSSPAPSLVYEVTVNDFESKVRAVDLAILESLASIDRSQHIIQHKTIESRTYKDQEFYYQNLTFHLDDVFPFLEELHKNLQQHAPQAKLSTVKDNPRDLEIALFGQPTHHLFIPLSQPLQTSTPVQPSARLVIVIDDLGESVPVAKRLANLSVPITFSVLPYTTRAKDVANLARKNDRELLLHLPCEPEGYPQRANSGPGTLKVSMSPALLEQTLVNNLARLPDVDGVNNHMGSRLTRDKAAMTIVLSHIQGRGKFFLDSVTTPRTVVQEVSTNLGMAYLRRNIFLDNTQAKQAILLQLKKSESLAKRTGLAIAIGHPYPETLQALETWVKSRDLDITICKLQDI